MLHIAGQTSGLMGGRRVSKKKFKIFFPQATPSPSAIYYYYDTIKTQLLKFKFLTYHPNLGLFLRQGVISHSRFISQVGCKSHSSLASPLKSFPLQTDLIKSIPIIFLKFVLIFFNAVHANYFRSRTIE